MQYDRSLLEKIWFINEVCLPTKQLTSIICIQTQYLRPPTHMLPWQRLALMLINFLSFFADPEDPVVYYDARLLTDHEYEAISVPADLRHIEAQLERNKRKKLLNRIFRPGGGKFGNEYVEQARGPFLLASLPHRDRPSSSGYTPVHLTVTRQNTASTDSNSNISVV